MPPNFYPEGSVVLAGDDELRTLHKIGAGSGSGSSSGQGGLSGVGSPEGVVTASPGAVYTDTSTGGFWNKVTGTGNTGWNQLIV